MNRKQENRITVYFKDDVLPFVKYLRTKKLLSSICSNAVKKVQGQIGDPPLA